MKKLSFFILTLFVSSTCIASVSASENSIAFSQAEKTCGEYQTHLENYLDTALPAYLDENLTKSNQINITKYKTYLQDSSNKQIEITLEKDIVKVQFATAELFNLAKKSFIVDTIYNPFGINTSMFPYTFTAEKIKDYVLHSDDMLLFCDGIWMFAENNSMEQEDIKIATNKLKENTKVMNSLMKKFTLETSKIKNKKIPATILKNNNLSLWKLKTILDHLEVQNAKG